ncbi:hypothetical protein E2562_006371 [Oryza meyeriana var. granulata]|uniref:Uncharacterized protein n=1 Tax=Oryza meyeriana var. granulata TaxID=110450 RepID=A0A6G1EHP7_9ORYZ|nr:hypothetical protein E2562_006371 [Oryza meyeriana var. granulata]
MEDRDRGAVHKDVPGPAAGAVDGEDVGDDCGGFSFPVPPLAADAFIVPVYPVFGRPMSPPPRDPVEEEEPETATVRVPLSRLLLEEREFRARQRESSGTPVQQRPDDEGGGDGELEEVPPESYCLWAPGGQSTPASPRRCRKSGSTGSVLRWRRISERLVRRSQSDGKEKFVFLNAGPALHPPKDDEDVGGSKGDGGRHSWSYYRKGGGGSGSGGRRKSYLPYKQELVGLFANVNGLRRSYHLF